jgi:geranylgeranyl reductase
MKEMFDVIVVGGGPAGAIAAETLAKAGSRVVLIERSFRKIKPCGGGTPSVSFDEFQINKVEIQKKIKTLSTISPSGERLDIRIKKGYLAMVERDTFDQTLRCKAEDAGAELVEAEFIRIKENKKRVIISVSDTKKEYDIAADYMIAADGINSRVASAIGLKALPSVYTIQEEADSQSADGFNELQHCEFWFGFNHAPHFYAWVFPKKGYVDLGTASTDGRALKMLMQNFKKRRGVIENGPQRVYRLPLKQRKSLVKGRVLFAGDAAGLVMPLSYEGIYYAMRSGKMAATSLINENPQQYQRQWDKTYRRQFRMMRLLRTYFMKSEQRVEQMFVLHRRRDIQEASLRLWLEKDTGWSVFLSYLNFFRKWIR